MLAAVSVMVARPVLPEATEIGLAKVNADPPLNVALAEPLVSPMVMVPVPKAFALVVPLTVPDLIVTPLLKELLLPLKVNADVLLFSMTPVTFPPITPLITSVALPAPELVIVPTLLILAPESVMMPAPVALRVRLLPVPALLILPLKMRLLPAAVSVRA